MTWIRVDANVARSRLVDVLRTSCGLSRAAAVGSVVLLWCECVVADNGGRIGHLSDTWIEDAAGWTGEPGKLAAAIREHHLTDGRVKDWDEYQGALEQRREADRLRKRAERERLAAEKSAGSHAEMSHSVPQTSAGRPNATVTSTLTKPLSLSRARTSETDSGPMLDRSAAPQLSPDHLQALETLAGWLPNARDALSHILVATTHPETLVGFIRSLREPMGGKVYRDDAIARALIDLALNKQNLELLSARSMRRYVEDAAAAIEAETHQAPNGNGTRLETGALERLEAEAGEIFGSIRGLISTRDLHGQGIKKYLPKGEVEKLGTRAVRAYEAVGGSDRFLESSGEKLGFLLRDFTKMYVNSKPD